MNLCRKGAAWGYYHCAACGLPCRFNKSPKITNFAPSYENEMKQEQVVHVCLGDDRHFYFGSIAAIFDRFTPDELGVTMAALWNYGLAPDHPYINNKCRIYRGTIKRKHQTK